MSPQRIQRKRTGGWRMPEGARSVARPSRWGNPFGADGSTVTGQRWSMVRENWRWANSTAWLGDVAYTSHSDERAAVEHAVEMFRMLCYVSARDYPERFEGWIGPLRGADLACFCPLDQPCHADVLLELANPPHTAGCGLEQFGATRIAYSVPTSGAGAA